MKAKKLLSLILAAMLVSSTSIVASAAYIGEDGTFVDDSITEGGVIVDTVIPTIPTIGSSSDDDSSEPTIGSSSENDENDDIVIPDDDKNDDSTGGSSGNTGGGTTGDSSKPTIGSSSDDDTIVESEEDKISPPPSVDGDTSDDDADEDASDDKPVVTPDPSPDDSDDNDDTDSDGKDEPVMGDPPLADKDDKTDEDDIETPVVPDISYPTIKPNFPTTDTNDTAAEDETDVFSDFSSFETDLTDKMTELKLDKEVIEYVTTEEGVAALTEYFDYCSEEFENISSENLTSLAVFYMTMSYENRLPDVDEFTDAVKEQLLILDEKFDISVFDNEDFIENLIEIYNEYAKRYDDDDISLCEFICNAVYGTAVDIVTEA